MVEFGESRTVGRHGVPGGVAWSGLLLAYALVGCGGDVPTTTVTESDSAGVMITLSADRPLAYARVDDEPSLSLGGPESTGPTQFYRIQGVRVDAAGRIWVADGQSGELRVFESDGAVWDILGGPGDGPGEFQRIRLLGFGPADSVVVADDANDRVTWVSPDGRIGRTQRIPSGENPPPRLFGVFPDGSLLGQVPRMLAAGKIAPGSLLPGTVNLARVRPETGEQIPYGTADGPLWIWTGRVQVPMPFTINAGFDVVGETVHLASGPDFRIRVFEAGRVLASYGVVRAPRPVSDQDEEAWRALFEGMFPESRRLEVLAGLDHEARPDLLPGYARVLAADDGCVWAQVYDPDLSAPAWWDVYASDHAWKGQVEMPAGFRLMAVTGSSVVGVWYDEDGVEYLRRYGLRRSGAAAEGL